jgi:CO/xanthine dehydrogenase FAD-binding subunit
MEPIRLHAVEEQLEGQAVNTANNTIDMQRLLAALQSGMANFQPPSDFRASNAYRRVSGLKLAYRVLEEAIDIARWRSVAGRSELGPYGRK